MATSTTPAIRAASGAEITPATLEMASGLANALASNQKTGKYSSGGREPSSLIILTQDNIFCRCLSIPVLYSRNVLIGIKSDVDLHPNDHLQRDAEGLQSQRINVLR